MHPQIIPAAQYLRMSTENQQYSLQNQADAISRYAVEHGFLIARTYSDAAKSGLRLKNRTGLKQLLKDVVEGQTDFRAVLVYDVSRWGRFQDMDESAHYEYLCKSAGIPVHYCGEQFCNDNSMSALILKALKRTMAGEYSRELSVKVYAGLSRLAKMGYKVGGPAPYGLRRLLVDMNGEPKQLLAEGERKNLTNERVILVPGPSNEIEVVRRIFREFAQEGMPLRRIADRLNEDRIPFLRGSKWTVCIVKNVLERTNYIGMQVWGRTTAYLSSLPKRVSIDRWAICPNAYQPIITWELFQAAQARFANFTCNLSDEQILDRVRAALAVRGTLNKTVLDGAMMRPGVGVCRSRFGGLMQVYARLGITNPKVSAMLGSRQRFALIRQQLIEDLVSRFPTRLHEVRKNRRYPARLRDRRTGRIFAVASAPCDPLKTGSLRWRLDYLAKPHDRKRMTVLALLNSENNGIHEIRVFRKMDFPGRSIRILQGNSWLASGSVLGDPEDFFNAVNCVLRK
jgi:DNA invertase Pin-like site-specific DNA recombinase